MISYKSYVLVVCCTGQSAIPGAVEQVITNALSRKKMSKRYVWRNFSFSFFLFTYDPLGSDRAWVLGMKCERLGLNLYTGRREAGMCVLMDCV